MKNWKTTLAGLIVAGVGTAVAMHWISAEVGGAILTIATAVGLIAAKDSNVTGGTTKQ